MGDRTNSGSNNVELMRFKCSRPAPVAAEDEEQREHKHNEQRRDNKFFRNHDVSLLSLPEVLTKCQGFWYTCSLPLTFVSRLRKKKLSARQYYLAFNKLYRLILH